MTSRRTSPRSIAAAVLAGLALLLAGCDSEPPTAAASSTPDLSTPDGVADAFAAAYAAGDTPSACTLAGGQALQHMTEVGQCGHTQWPAVQFWRGEVCRHAAADPNLPAGVPVQVFDFHTAGPAAGYSGFVVGLEPSGTSWRVTLVGPDVSGVMAGECVDASTGPSS